MTEPMVLTYEERGSGPTLLLVHGFPLDSSMWIEQLKGLAKIRTVVAVNLRGHGYTQIDKADGFSMDLFADDLAATIDDLGQQQVDLCGLSMGGYVAMAFLRRHPEKVRTLILADTKAEPDTDEGKAGRDKVAALVREQGMEPLADMLIDKMLSPDADDAHRASLRRMFLSTPQETAAADAEAMRDRPDSTSDLAGITVPVLWIHGEQDQMMPIDGARATAEKIPGVTFAAIPGGGHMSPMENPQAANTAMTEFLKAHTPPKK